MSDRLLLLVGTLRNFLPKLLIRLFLESTPSTMFNNKLFVTFIETYSFTILGPHYLSANCILLIVHLSVSVACSSSEISSLGFFIYLPFFSGHFFIHLRQNFCLYIFSLLSKFWELISWIGALSNAVCL